MAEAEKANLALKLKIQELEASAAKAAEPNPMVQALMDKIESLEQKVQNGDIKNKRKPPSDEESENDEGEDSDGSASDDDDSITTPSGQKVPRFHQLV